MLNLKVTNNCARNCRDIASKHINNIISEVSNLSAKNTPKSKQRKKKLHQTIESFATKLLSLG